jgi:molybdopterin-binding protein
MVPEPPFGERLRVSLATEPPLVAEVTRHSAEALGLQPGQRVHASFKATAVVTYR